MCLDCYLSLDMVILLHWCEVWTKQELFCVQDVPDMVPSAFPLSGGEKGVKKNPELGGTLASNQQAANLSDWRRDESSRVHLKLPAVVLTVCVLMCMHEEREVCRFLYPCVELYVKLLQMVRVSAALPLVSSSQRFLSVGVKGFFDHTGYRAFL